MIDCSWFHGFPYADIAAPGPAVVCTTTGDAALAQRCVDEVAQWIWSHREAFRPTFPTPAQGVALALSAAEGHFCRQRRLEYGCDCIDSA
ncbi:M81 family metallopeptidase [Cupriavidus necator]|uniref:M81 family metallopeptidase n=1 Tax=Cupriavidus necator TaxID=106590 RepID=UPI000302FEEA|nr:M81 family metallopeptidase [Cupriavidus necator]WKA40466.1 M81 family metallopeptidase [Cupriavidus necator]